MSGQNGCSAAFGAAPSLVHCERFVPGLPYPRMSHSTVLPIAGKPEHSTTRRRVAWIAALLGIWTLFALLSIAQGIARGADRHSIPWSILIADRLADWYSCALFTPAYFWLARHYPVTRRDWLRGLLVHLAATQLFVVIKYTLYVAVGIALGLRPTAVPVVAQVLRAIQGNIVFENMIFWALAGVVHAIEFQRHALEREARAERLRAELTQARLDALVGQLHPHFLFNALNTVSSLMHRDVPAADVVLARIGDLLRRTLRAGERPEVTLAEELEMLDDYLAIMRARFHDRLTVDVHAAPGTERALVPHFVLQPLVENAIEHGIAERAGAGRIDVRVTREDTRLVLTIADDGPGLSTLTRRSATQDGEHVGIGLANTRRRLAALYGDDHALTLTNRSTGGLVARIELPFRQARSDDAPPPLEEQSQTALTSAAT
jgi:two-component system, LytTR family, sensor kinase